MNPKQKDILEKLKKQVNDDKNLSPEEKQKKLAAIETAAKVASEISDFKEDYSGIADTKDIVQSQTDTKTHVREEFNNTIKKEAELQGKNFDSLYIKTGEPNLVVDGGLHDVKENILDKYEFKVSNDFKTKVLKIAEKLEEYGINDPAYGGEKGFKVYALYKYIEVRNAYITAINNSDVEKIVELQPQYDTVMSRYKELLDMTLELSSTETVDNLDVERETIYPPELWYREIAVSNLNGIFQGLTYCKSNNIEFSDYIENPYKYFKENLDKTWVNYKNEYILPKTEKLSTRLAKILDIQASEERGTDYNGDITKQSAFGIRAIELYQKLDKGEGLEGRSLFSALSANISKAYLAINNLFYTNYLTPAGVEGLKNVFLIGNTVDNLAELDPKYMDPNTFEMNKYPYRESLKTAELGDDFIEKTVTTAIETFFEAKQMQEEADGYCGPILDGNKLLYTVTSLFNDVLMERDLSANPKLAKGLLEFCKDPTKAFSKIGKELGHTGLDRLDLLNEVVDSTDPSKENLPNPMIASNTAKMKAVIGTILEGNTLNQRGFEKAFSQLKTIQLEQQYNRKPSILHPFKRRDWNRNNAAMNALKNDIYGKLSAFGVKGETLDEMLNDPEKANTFITGMGKQSLINKEKIKNAFDKAFDKGTVDDLTPEQKEAYQTGKDSPELTEAQTILKGNAINEKNLNVAVDLLKQIKAAGNTPDVQEMTQYIFGELRDKGLDDATLRNTVDGKVEVSSYIGEFAEDKSIVYDLDQEEFRQNLQDAVEDGKIIDLDEPVKNNIEQPEKIKEKELHS